MSTEKYTISGSQLVDKIKQLIHEGNIRRVRVLHEGRTVLEIPLTFGASAAHWDMRLETTFEYPVV